MQDTVWEREYCNPQLVTKNEKPQKDTLRFLKFLKKEEGVNVEGLRVLDLGCGTGRNSNYVAELGNTVTGFEISQTAIDLARGRAEEKRLSVDYQRQNIGAQYSFGDDEFDLILDVISSNSLTEQEREIYLAETHRVLKNGGYFFVKILCKDGDKNTKMLLKKSPGAEPNTYINKNMGLTERVFSEQDFRNFYSKYFYIIRLEKKTSYTRFKNQSYKRNFWIAYMRNKKYVPVIRDLVFTNTSI